MASAKMWPTLDSRWAGVYTSPMMRTSHFLIRCLLIVPFMLTTGALFAQTPENTAPPDTLQQAREQLQSIQHSLIEKREQLEQLRARLSRATDSGEKEDLQRQINQEELEMSTLRRSFENIALGGVDSSVFDPDRLNLQFNWQEELELILEPLFQKMKDLTDKPRQIEQLKSQIAILDNKLRVVNRALENLERLLADDLDRSTRQWLDVIHKAWSQQKNDFQRERDITELRLTVILSDTDTLLNRIRGSTGQFITGTGRNLVLSMLAFIGTLALMKGLHFLYHRFRKHNAVRRSTARRILTYAFQAFTIFVSIAAALIVLYLLGDMVLLVIIIILLVLLLVGLRSKLPFIIEEMRMLLDVGPVREHERVIYRDLPWMVRSLGMYSYLNNPALEGVLRLPMHEMTGLVSRPCRDDEPWFPCQKGDWIMFTDGTIGQILRQTPDVVQIQAGGSILNCNTASFMNEKIRNLSHGYNVSITFGIDYQHRADSTGTVPDILRKHIEQELQQAEFSRHVQSVLVEFKEATPSSLNYVVAVSMNGAGANAHGSVTRLLQSACIDCANANGWVMPFNQLTLNARSDSGLSGAFSLKNL